MKTECELCGTCCEKGGPALHVEDLALVEDAIISIDDLVTIRPGEIVLQPETGRPEITDFELIKIKGSGSDWCCRFLHPVKRTCTIYENRPFTCRLLKCWDPEDVLEVTGKKILSRYDLIGKQDPLRQLAEFYDQQFSLPDMIEIKVQLGSETRRGSVLDDLRELCEKDLMFRSLAVERFRLPLERELFYFGRPIFQLLAPLGVNVRETAHGLELEYCGE
jgi:Fe-S-cluster containining protein